MESGEWKMYKNIIETLIALFFAYCIAAGMFLFPIVMYEMSELINDVKYGNIIIRVHTSYKCKMVKTLKEE